MRLSTFLPYTGPLSAVPDLVQFASAVEGLGYTRVRVGEHIVYPRQTKSTYPYSPGGQRKVDVNSNQLEMFTLFSYLAATTTRLQFQSGVLLLPLRSPFVTARAAATLDYLSGGRLSLEIGVGWMRDEFDIIGVPFEERGAVTDESLFVLRTLFEDRGAFAGKYFSFPELNFRPLPVQSPFPFWIGGGCAPPALRRIATFAVGWSPMGCTPAEVSAAQPELAALLAEGGRSLVDIDIQANTGPLDPTLVSKEQLLDQVQQLQELGFTSLTIDVGAVRSNSLMDTLSALEWAAEIAGV